MMKKFLLTALLGAALLGASAATETFTFSYLPDPVSLMDLTGLGTTEVELNSVAIQLNQPAYAGMKITKIDAYLNLDERGFEYVDQTGVFITTGTLDGLPNNEYNMLPLTPVELKMVPFAGDQFAVLSYELENPVTIGQQPLYIGYQFYLNKVVDVTRYPILLDNSEMGVPGSFYIRAASLFGAWTADWNAKGMAAIYVTIEREVADNALAVNNPGTTYAEVDKEFNVILPVGNPGISPVSELTYKYSIDGGEEFTNTITLESPLKPSIDKSYEVLLPIQAVGMAGEYTMELTVTEVNGQPNEAPTTSTSFELDVFPYMPQHRPLVEEYTALRCGWCPRGYVAMEYLDEEYPDDAVVVCYHGNFGNNYDPMMVTGIMPVPTSSFPTASIDRIGLIDPYYGDYTDGMRDLGIVDDMFARAKVPTIADISISNVNVNPTDSVITFTSNVTFMKNVKDDEYRIGYTLTCDGMENASWSQKNDFSGRGEYSSAPLLDDLVKMRPNIYGLVFNDIAIDTKAMKGLANSLTNIEVGTPVANEYEFNVKNVLNLYGESLNPYIRIHRMYIVAYVIDRSNSQVINAVKFPVREVYSGVENVAVENTSVVSTVYYNLQGQKVSNPDKGIYVKSETLSDGSVKTSKVVY